MPFLGCAVGVALPQSLVSFCLWHPVLGLLGLTCSSFVLLQTSGLQAAYSPKHMLSAKKRSVLRVTSNHYQSLHYPANETVQPPQ
jgi:hypothetical protein